MLNLRVLCVKFFLLVFLIASLTTSAHAYTVAGVGKGGFADFSKAIVFTGIGCPVNAETIATSGGAKTCAIPMRPVGDGSWVCTAVIFPGANYKYYFEYRIPRFEDTNGWKNSPATGGRDQDQERDITIPSTAEHGYIVYNIFGDRDVRAKQGMAKQGTAWDTELTVANPDVAQYRGTVDVDNTGDNDTGNLNNNNNYSFNVAQVADTTVVLRWSLSHGGDGFAPTIEGAREFDETSTYTPYGFRILRAKLTPSASATPITNLVFSDTIVNAVTGDTYWSPHRSKIGIGWYSDGITFTDTSLPANTAVGDSYVYTVIWHDAYGNANDTSNENFTGGNGLYYRSASKEALFIVEKFDQEVVFPNGATEGRIRVTPYVDGVPQPWRSFWAKAFIATRKGG